MSPKCKKEMRVVRKDVSFGKNKKKYKWTIWWCEKDDVWINAEIPNE